MTHASDSFAAIVRAAASAARARSSPAARRSRPTCRSITQFGVYKLDINQGNYLSQDMVDKLKVGRPSRR